MKPSRLATLLVTCFVLAACGAGDPPETAPENVSVSAGDGSATVSWTAVDGLKYWIFYAEGTTLDYATRKTLPSYRAVYEISPPYTVGGLTNGTPYAFLVAAAKDESRAGPTAAAVTTTPRPAGASWTVATPTGTESLNAVAASLGLFVAVGDSGRMFSSLDGVAWTALTSGTTARLNAVTYAKSTWVAVGAGGTVLTSQDAVTWTPRSGGTASELRGVGLVAGRYVAVGDGGVIVTSTDASNWSATASGTAQTLHAVASNGVDRIVAVGAGGTVLTAADGLAWSAVASPVANDLRGATYGAGTFAIVGSGGAALWSGDGQSFGVASAPAGELRAAVYASRFVAVGSSGAVASSSDGKTWSAEASGTTATLNAVSFGAFRYAAVGATGTNLTSK